MSLDHGDKDIARSANGVELLWRERRAVYAAIKVHVKGVIRGADHKSRFRAEARLNEQGLAVCLVLDVFDPSRPKHNISPLVVSGRQKRSVRVLRPMSRPVLFRKALGALAPFYRVLCQKRLDPARSIGFENDNLIRLKLFSADACEGFWEGRSSQGADRGRD
jgi:hypothetical protein